MFARSIIDFTSLALILILILILILALILTITQANNNTPQSRNKRSPRGIYTILFYFILFALSLHLGC